MPRKLLLFKVGLYCLLILQASLLQADESDEKRKLQELSKKIQSVQSDIQSASREIRVLESDLEKTERQLAATRQTIADTRRKIADQEKRLADLQQQKQALEKLRNEQSRAIATQINLSYRLGREPTLKLLLNMEDPAQISRILRYHDYFLKARAGKLADYLSTIEQFTRVEQEQQQTLDLLKSERDQLEQQLAQGTKQNTKRTLSLQALNKSQQSDQQLLDKLQTERKRLEAVLKQLEQALANIEIPATYSPFSQQKGRLPWPVKGTLAQRFGQFRNTKMTWEGWLINAPEGTEVRAIHYGRIVFADYLRGHGLLVVIDHGQGYMSLYAHNQILLADTGDWISSGTPIARVGESGGQQKPGLYFEIRYKGNPTNPASWMSQ